MRKRFGSRGAGISGDIDAAQGVVAFDGQFEPFGEGGREFADQAAAAGHVNGRGLRRARLAAVINNRAREL